jgi:hypothetical protein
MEEKNNYLMMILTNVLGRDYHLLIFFFFPALPSIFMDLLRLNGYFNEIRQLKRFLFEMFKVVVLAAN